MAICYYHNDRAGIGVCMRCRKVICASCCTRVDGVNHCHRCLAALGKRSDRPVQSAAPTTIAALFLAGVGWVGLALLFWFLQGKLAP